LACATCLGRYLKKSKTHYAEKNSFIVLPSFEKPLCPSKPNRVDDTRVLEMEKSGREQHKKGPEITSADDEIPAVETAEVGGREESGQQGVSESQAER
jgi:hypothetical protein